MYINALGNVQCAHTDHMSNDIWSWRVSWWLPTYQMDFCCSAFLQFKLAIFIHQEHRDTILTTCHLHVKQQIPVQQADDTLVYWALKSSYTDALKLLDSIQLRNHQLRENTGFVVNCCWTREHALALHMLWKGDLMQKGTYDTSSNCPRGLNLEFILNKSHQRICASSGG